MPTRSQFETEAEWREELRRWYAGMALTGLLSDPDREGDDEAFVLDAFRFADLMIAAPAAA